ncbi:MAG: hypothetical protein MZV70_39650 [Desulfobacterales bacterium]|nr:hypothetical protein [Desulfobacterales bacterium]
MNAQGHGADRERRPAVAQEVVDDALGDLRSDRIAGTDEQDGATAGGLRDPPPQELAHVLLIAAGEIPDLDRHPVQPHRRRLAAIGLGTAERGRYAEGRQVTPDERLDTLDAVRVPDVQKLDDCRAIDHCRISP